jgi:Holliday junction resolvase RusA-like endonuclease
MSHYTSPTDFELRLTIKGRPVSWKNSKTPRLVPFKGRGMTGTCCRCKQRVGIALVHSAQAGSWMRAAKKQLADQIHPCCPLPKTVPLWAEIHSYKATRGNIDASNLYQGPEDALQRAGIIEDDSAIEHHDGSRRHYDKDNPRVEIILRPA